MKTNTANNHTTMPLY